MTKRMPFLKISYLTISLSYTCEENSTWPSLKHSGSISGKKNKLRVYYLSWLRNKILHNDPEVEKKQGWTTVGDLEGCVHYKVGTSRSSQDSCRRRDVRNSAAYQVFLLQYWYCFLFNFNFSVYLWVTEGRWFYFGLRIAINNSYFDLFF